MLPGESSCPDDSVYVWQRGVESARPSYGRPYRPLFKERKKYLRWCSKKHPGRNFDASRANPPERLFEMYFKVKIAALRLFATLPIFAGNLRSTAAATSVLAITDKTQKVAYQQNQPMLLCCFLGSQDDESKPW